VIGVKSENMQRITVPKLKANSPKRKRWNWLMLTLPISFACIWLQGFNPEKLQALDDPNRVFIANTWQHASFPVENFQSYTSGYGYRISPIDGEVQFHRGLDLAAPMGSYVRNWWTGKVVELSDDTNCGTSVTIQSGRWKHIYCHLNGYVETTANGRYLIDSQGGIQLREKQQIPVGARIGRVGMTGRTTGPHLHWGLKYGDSYVDPALVLREMHKRQTVIRNS
jgi:murein DD-endopeptidase MepM/ murein hydrolase activator NlpD